MLDSLLIKNYRLFEHLEVETLKRINLIVGKNNVGKTAMLEALAIYFNGGVAGVLQEIVRDRKCFGDYYGDYQDQAIDILSDFFHNGNLDKDLSIASIKDKNKVVSVSVSSHNVKMTFNEQEDILDFKYYPLNTSIFYSNQVALVRTRQVKKSKLADLWSEMALTSNEDYILEGLQILDNRIDRLSFIEENDDWAAIVRVQGLDKPVKLATMGDGMNHILAMMLHLVERKDGYFLVDEFETGLHWSVQKDLWKVIIHLAEKLNIQVFATTHSRDTIWALEEVAKEQNYQDAQLIKLYRNKKGVLKANCFDTENLAIAMAQNVELR